MSARPVLLFDLDGTLADTAPDLCHTMNVILARHGREEVPEARVRHLVGGGARLLMERGFKETGEPAGEVQLDQAFQDFIAYYSEHIADHTVLWPGVLAQLERLAEHGAAMAVCTNKIESLARQVLEALSLTHFFPVVIGGDTLPVKKPHPDHLLEAVRRLGGDAGRAIMVGDSAPDIDAALAAGIPSIALSFGYTRVPVGELGADIVIDHYDAFPDALRRLAPEAFAGF